MIFKTFVYGAAVIPFVFFAEYYVLKLFVKFNLSPAAAYSPLLIFTLAGIEEYFKYSAAKTAALKSKYFDEPVDALIYLVTAALGFAALENAIYVFDGFTQKEFLPTLLSGNFRFLGASLVHVVSSAALGTSIAFSFFHKKHTKINIFLGFCTAALLHGLYNYFILKNSGGIFTVFLAVWVFAAIIIYIFEKIKRMPKPAN